MGKELIAAWTFSKQRLERQKGWQQVGDKPLLEIGQVAVQNSSPEAVSNIQIQMTLQNWKIINNPSQDADIRGLANGSLTLPQRKGARQRSKPPVIKHSENTTQKQDSWWATELIMEPEDNMQT
jgi:hypothetical protein